MSAATPETLPNTSEGLSASEKRPGRPKAKAQSVPAVELTLSAATRAYVTRSGVTLVQGRQAWHLSDREAEKLARAVLDVS